MLARRRITDARGHTIFRGGNNEIRTLCRVNHDCVGGRVLSVMLQPLATSKTVVAQAPQAPMFEVDPFWPKPLPNHWVTGSTIGLSVDAQDNVWTIHRPDAVEANFKAADLKANQAVDDEVQPGQPGARELNGSDWGLL